MNRSLNICLIAVMLLARVASAAEPVTDYLTTPVLKKAWESISLSKPAEAISALQSQKPSRGTESIHHYLLGRALEAAAQTTEAIEEYRLAYLAAPAGIIREEALLARGAAYYRIQNYYEAATDSAVFLKLFPSSPSSGAARLRLAQGLARSGRTKEALTHFERVTRMPEALYGKANAQQALGLTREADATYGAALAAAPDMVWNADDTLYHIGENRRLSGRPADAVNYLTPVKAPYFRALADISLGLIAADAGQADKAEQHVKAALASTDRQVRRRALITLSGILLKAGKTAEARQCLEEIRLHHPYTAEYDAAAVMLSKAAAQEGNYDEAVRLLRELVNRRAPVREALDQIESMVRDLIAKRDAARLASLWEAAGSLLLDSSRERLLLDIAELLKGQERHFTAIMNFLARHGSEAAKRSSQLALASYYAEAGDTRRSREYLNKAGARRNDDDVLRAEARVLLAEKNEKAAAEKAVQIRKPGESDMRLLALAARSERGRQLLSRLEQAAQSGRSAETCIEVADIHYEKGNKAEALKYYRMAAEREPRNEWALYRTALLVPGREAEDLLKRLENGASAVSGVARARLRELAIARMTEEGS